MTNRRRTASAARRLAAAAYLAGVYGLGAVVWHWVRGKSWGDSLAFASTLTVSVLVSVWLSAAVRRRAGRGDG
ncbi:MULTISPECIES: hypothetical protein [Streptomyces althioticus group]|uniref:Integral membrane protein n=1 Tax=Streptomyces griseorubens TaxID=66897 RepID=A0ABR4T6J8_9ACTN|nr:MULTISPECIES: hypothetical protein [Actinomycetes]ALV49841.1 hypothetical protein ASR50_10715 [Streptomyces sp. 4F]KEG42616.1 hypothetical protein DJ64_30970 [Streptomyces griseorubens]MCC9685702.1 hypothetical protein [Streptomyces sp. MNU103]